MPDSATGAKRCSRCKEFKSRETGFYKNRRAADGLHNECKECCRDREGNPERQEYNRRKARQRYHADVEASRARGRAWAAANPGRVQENRRQYYAKLKEQVFQHYGTSCACCGSAEKLSIDHINGGGSAHRASLYGRPNGAMDNFYRWLIRNGFPEGYQTLCQSCNCSKRDGGRCRLFHGVDCPACGHHLTPDDIPVLRDTTPGTRHMRRQKTAQ